jgi:hypothetical protein
MTALRTTNQHSLLPTDDRHPLGELVLLCHIIFAEEYCGHFMALSFRYHSLTETQQMQLFIVGLGEPLFTYVPLQRPMALDDAIMFA